MLSLGPLDLLVPVICILTAIIYIPITFIVLVKNRSPQLRSWSAFRQAWFARFWSFFGWGSRWLFASDVEAVLSQAHGVVLDVGTGSGDWLYLFSPERNKNISKLLLLEPNVGFHPALQRRAQELGLSDRCEILNGGVEDLERIGIQKGTVDTIATIHVLCSVSSPQRSIKELFQYLKPGGRWLVYEHIKIKDKSRIAAAVQGGGVSISFILFFLCFGLADLPKLGGFDTIWHLLFDNCSLTRDTEDLLLFTGKWTSTDLRPGSNQGQFNQLPHTVGVCVK